MQTTPVAVRALDEHPPPLPPLPPLPPPPKRVVHREPVRWTPDEMEGAKLVAGMILVLFLGGLSIAFVDAVVSDKCNCGNNGCTRRIHQSMQRH